MKRLVIAIPCSWDRISRTFFESFIQMTSLPVLKQLEEKYDIETKFMINNTFPIDRNRNQTVELCSFRYRADYILWLDADQTFPRETILNLFERVSDEFPVVSGVYFKKGEPNSAVLGHYTNNLEPHVYTQLKDIGLMTKTGQQCLFYQAHANFVHDRAFPIDVSGMGCLLMKADIFKRLEQPYFKYFDHYQIHNWPTDGTSEEMWFFCQLKKAGINVLCDPRVLCGHLKESEVALVGGSVLCV